MAEDGEIISEEFQIKHSSTLENLLIYKEFFNVLVNDKYSISKKDFWNKKDELFKKIKFCDEIENQIKVLSKEVYESFINKLKLVELGDEDIEEWNFSPESKLTMEKYALERAFYHSDFSDDIVFENHIKSFPDNNRMYFLKLNKIFHMGYIGKHLKTIKYKK